MHYSWNQTLLPVEYVRVPPKLLWTPRFRVMESTERDIIKADSDSQVLVTPTGRTTLDIYQRINVACDLNLLYFPYDRQVCKVPFTFWSILMLRLSDGNFLFITGFQSFKSVYLKPVINTPSFQLSSQNFKLSFLTLLRMLKLKNYL